MELLTPEIIQGLGSSGIFVIFLFFFWKYIESNNQRMKETLESKDERIKEITDKVFSAFEKNTAATEKHTEAINRLDNHLRNRA